MSDGDWTVRIEKASSDADKVKLHNDRFNVWNTFINSFAEKHNLSIKIEERPSDGASAFEKLVVGKGNTFAKKTLYENQTPVVVFDAGFGSMDATSDLDISVVSTNINVLTEWIQYLHEQQKKINITFTRYWDSNFYFVPGIVVKSKLVLKLQIEIEKALPKKETMIRDAEMIENYTKAYADKTSIKMGEYYVFPNADADGFNKDVEIKQYEAMEYFANICLNVEDNHQQINTDLACTKIEGLICAGSLVICGVFGKELQKKYMGKMENSQPWRLVTAFEMLWNLKIHMDGNNVKTKYLERLDNVLKKGDNTCTENIRNKITENIKKIKKEHKMTPLPGVLSLINMVIEDEQNGTQCPEETTEIKNRTLEDNIELLKQMITKYANSDSVGTTPVTDPPVANFITYCVKECMFNSP